MVANIQGEPEGPLPDFLWMPISAGEQALLTVNLEPGTYAGTVPSARLC